MATHRELLIAAFPASKHPGNPRLLRPDAIDDSDVAFLYDKESTPWYELDPAVLDREASCLSALSDDGLRYVLPSYIAMFAQGYQDSNGWLDRLLNVLASKGRGGLNISESQFKVIDEMLLSEAAKIGREFGAGGSAHGMAYDELVASVRKSQLGHL